MFQLSLASKELFHSNFLAWIASLPEKTEKNHPFRILMKSLGATNVDNWPETWYVAREYHNFDLCVLNRMPDDYDEDEDDDNEQKDNRPEKEETGKTKSKVELLLVLENKVKSIPYITQLHEYQDKIIEYNFDILKKKDTILRYKWQISSKGVADHIEKDKKKGNSDPGYSYPDNISRARKLMQEQVDHVLLTMSTEFPDIKSISNEGAWKVSSYYDYVASLNGISSRFINGSKERVILDDYITQLRALTDLHSEWCLENNHDAFLARPFLEKEDAKLKELRIHDLFHKQRYAKICALLRDRLKEVLDHYKIALKDQMIIQKGEEECNGKAIVNFGYLHGEPLLDIWLGYENYAYTIQIQGDAYEHGIQKMVLSTNEAGNSVALWKEIWNEGKSGQAIRKKDEWNWLCPFKDLKDPFDKNGYIIQDKGDVKYFPIHGPSIFDGSSPFPDKPQKRDGKYFPYLKYEMKDGLTFIYQYRKISKMATVSEVIEYITRDYRALYKMLFS